MVSIQFDSFFPPPATMYMLSPSEPSLITSCPGLKLDTTKRSTIMAVCSSSRRLRKSFLWMALTRSPVSLVMEGERGQVDLRSWQLPCTILTCHILYTGLTCAARAITVDLAEQKSCPILLKTGYSLIGSSDYQPVSFLDPGACNLQCLVDWFGRDDGRTALPDLRFNVIAAVGGELCSGQTEWL